MAVTSLPSPRLARFWSEPRRDVLWMTGINMLFALVLISQVFSPLKGLTGDEPHYLMVAHSLVTDGDLDLADDYIHERAWKSFYAGASLSPHYAPGKAGRYSTRSIGLAVFLAPFYWAGTVSGEILFWARLGMAFLYAALMINIYLFCRDLGLSRDASVAAWLFGSFSVPLAFYSYSLYPEVPAALLALASLRAMRNWDGKGWRAPLLAGLCLGLLPWLGIKYSVIAVAAAIIYLVLIARRKGPFLRPAGMLLLVPLLSLALFALFLYSIYGVVSPTVIYTGVGEGAKPLGGINRQAIPLGGFPLAHNLRVGLLYFFDQRDGLLFYSPIYIFGIAGLLLMIGKFPTARTMLFIFVPYILAYAVSGWNSGHAPAARPLVAVLWVLVVGMAAAFERVRGRLALAIRVVASTITVAFFAVLVAKNYLIYHVLLSHTAEQGNNFLSSVILPFDLTILFPNLLSMADIHPIPTVVCVSLAVTVVLILYRIGSNPRPGEPGLPSRALIAAGAGIPLLLFGAALLNAELISDEELRRIPLDAGQQARPEHRISLAFLDGNTYGFEPAHASEIPGLSKLGQGRRLPAFWVRGESTAAVDLVFPERPERFVIEINSRVPQTVELQVEGTLFKIDFKRPGWRPVIVPGRLAASWRYRALFRLRITSPKGFLPADYGSDDTRYLGCRVAVSPMENER